MRQIIIFFSAMILFAYSCTGSIKKSDEIRFGLMADAQYCDCDMNINRYYRNSLEKIDSCVEDFNREEVLFSVNLGDLIDRDPNESLDLALQHLSGLNSKIYHTTGNHDYDESMDNETLYSSLSMPHPYYSFAYGNWLFIMLNTNEVANYSNIKGTPLEGEYQAMKDKIFEEGRKNGATYNGGVSQEQLSWLDQQLSNSLSNNQKVVIFTHHPLYKAERLTALNDIEILDTITKYSNVKMVISGHHHSGDFGEYKGIQFITTEGMIETENENAYAIVELTDTKIEIIGRGRTKSYSFDI